MPKVKSKPSKKLIDLVNEYGSDILSTDNTVLFCKACGKTINHEKNSKSQFPTELCMAFIDAGIPLWKLKKKSLRGFLEKYTKQHIPSESSLRKNYIDNNFNNVMDRVRREAGDRSIMPALGLSNISITDDDNETCNVQLTNEPLLATDLSQKTLWIEVHKLYGHGFELHTVASNHAGSVVASACLATSEAHAKIFLWSTVDGRLKTSLEGHKLTDTRICFSHDDLMILSASRDRSWCLFSRQSDRGVLLFKKMMWNMKESAADIDHHVTVLEDSVTAVDIFPKDFENHLSHSSTVSRLKFSPLIEEDENGELTTQLAS
ncbi:putative elongator complex protein 2 [Trichinella sp. T8]|nr:putative elongator complex protein 2 [Trichinella sp. T8]